ncbi:NAD(P)-dependent dehydrogenase, short-chain alcohol dehydrogenase family [Flavobacterium glycines]|uniref:Dehydrogenase n=1 Tax=Flavobacterium glycines TaxID=551990 RepID=A0A1B9DS87_9FLAO|nr:SDR family oxidoreductase [Flavobacterium glycines]OCB72553.1 short-chain dehydrogenase [Flavobacterium glycines]GEL10045.1 dehydrogenase [Flavobacterium glycines]SDI83516.1 NAD(P)-dependent dehydrogenase, short-chain alcohol dehydrogenase family [Flavobacterium glycines]
MKKLENKVAVVTGGNSGIGLATAKLFAEQGAKVAITGRNKATIDNAVFEIGNAAIGVVSDVSDIKNIDKTYRTVKDTFGKIDVLVVNAGVYISAPLADYTEEMFDQTSDINFKGVFFSIQKALPYLNDGSSIIITASTVAYKGFAGAAAYSATKAAVRSLARTLSAELLDRKIRVNVLSPGPIDTPIFGRDGELKEEVDTKKEFLASIVPVKRLGSSEEMAEGFLYLASDDSKFMVGGELLLDGGVATL